MAVGSGSRVGSCDAEHNAPHLPTSRNELGGPGAVDAEMTQPA